MRTRRTGAAKESRGPAWIHDTADQKKWNDQFKKILKKDYANLDAVISSILADERLLQLCATKIRSYLDKDVSAWLYAQRKARGAATIKQLNTAIEGLRAAIGLCTTAGKKEFIPSLVKLLQDFSKALDSCKEAFATKRHGRDRDQGILQECHAFLEQRLGQSVTYVTLANLLNAGYEADGMSPEVPVDEGLVGKNLANFKKNNPLWHLFTPKS